MAAIEPSVLKPPAGQAQEDILEGAAPGQRGDRLQAPGPYGIEHGVAISGVHQDPVREHLDPLRWQVSDLVGGLLLFLERESKLKYLGRGVRIDELAR